MGNRVSYSCEQSLPLVSHPAERNLSHKILRHDFVNQLLLFATTFVSCFKFPGCAISRFRIKRTLFQSKSVERSYIPYCIPKRLKIHIFWLSTYLCQYLIKGNAPPNPSFDSFGSVRGVCDL